MTYYLIIILTLLCPSSVVYTTEEGHRSVRKLWSFIGLKCNNYALYLCYIYIYVCVYVCVYIYMCVCCLNSVFLMMAACCQNMEIVIDLMALSYI